MALPGKRAHGGVVHEPINHGCRRHLVGEYLRPFLKGEVRRQRNATSFIALRNKLNQQIRGFPIKGNVTKLVDLC
jgi:hypothetical protein